MQANPFIESVVNRVAGILCTIGIWIAFTLLVYFYGDAGWQMACLDSLVTAGLLATGGYLYGYVEGTVMSLQIRALLGVLVLAISLTGAFELRVLAVQETFDSFIYSIPFRVIFGLLCWIILIQWLRMNRIEHPMEEERDEPLEILEKEPQVCSDPILDRVSVKDGSRIHIIHLEELLYLQAGGDYVTLFTPTRQYVKEQTMKYFETHLSSTLFVRIHRSCIVNTEQILRVELFGKETYQVRLKNGVCLKASNAGYKLLKERLSL